MMGTCLISTGLLFDIIGAMILARGVIMSDETARTLAETRINGNRELEEQFRRGARVGRQGVHVLVFGFILQIIGTWVQFVLR